MTVSRIDQSELPPVLLRIVDAGQTRSCLCELLEIVNPAWENHGPPFTYKNTYHKGMDAISYSTARANLAKTMDRVCEDHTSMIITRQGQASVVMLSLEDYQALEETAYLLRSPANAKRLLSAVEALGRGKGKERKLAA